MPALRFRFHTRLILSHLAVAVVGVGLLAALAAVGILRAERSFAASRLEVLSVAAARFLEPPLAGYLAGQSDLEALQETLRFIPERDPTIEYALFLPDGTPLLVSQESSLGNSVENAPEVQAALNAGRGQASVIRPDEQGVERFYSAVRLVRGPETLGVLRLSVPTSAALAAARPTLILLALAAVAVIAAVGLFGALLSRRLAGPVQELAVEAERLAQGDFNARAPASGAFASTVELQCLSEAIDQLAGRLHASQDELRVFVANASHELRTPLTTLKLRAEALRAGALADPEVAPRFLAEIEEEVDRLSRLINGLLDLSRLQTQLDSSRFEVTDLGELATEVYEAFGARAERNRLALQLNIEPGLPPVVADEDQLWRVLMNLLDNALNYSPPGGQVALRVVNRSGDHGPRTVRVEVQDYGAGIPPDELNHIFEPFYRTENTRRRNSGSQGSGLGLAICKAIVESHGGQIGVNSRLGEGSLFWVELPAREAG